MIFDGANQLSRIIEINLEETFVELYPNPTKEELYFLGLDLNSEIKIFDVEGRQIKSVVVNPQLGEKVKINVADVKSGIYFIELASRGKVIIRKLVIY